MQYAAATGKIRLSKPYIKTNSNSVKKIGIKRMWGPTIGKNTNVKARLTTKKAAEPSKLFIEPNTLIRRFPTRSPTNPAAGSEIPTISTPNWNAAIESGKKSAAVAAMPRGSHASPAVLRSTP